VRLEFVKSPITKSETTSGEKITLQPGTPILVGDEEGRRVIVAPQDVRSYELAESTSAERAALQEYGFTWLVLG